MSDEKYSTLLERIMDNVRENTAMLSNMDKKMDLHIQETKYELRSIRDLDEIQNSVLKEHHDRSTQLKRENDLREEALRAEMAVQAKRIEALEAPRKWWAMTKKWLIGAGAIGGAMAGIIEAIRQFGGK